MPRVYCLAVDDGAGRRDGAIELGWACRYCGGDGKVEQYEDCRVCEGRAVIAGKTGRVLCEACGGCGTDGERPKPAVECGECDGVGLILTEAGQTLVEFIKRVSK